MKKLFILICLLTVINSINSQWAQYPSANLSGPIYFIQLLNNQTGYIGGNLYPSSSIYKFDNGGASGTVLYSYTSYTFHGFKRSNSGPIFLCGTEKCIVKSGIYLWETKNLSTGNFYAMNFPSENTGYAVGDGADNIYKTVNAGDNWSAILSPGNSVLKSVYFSNDLSGWVCGSNGLIARTTNGGLSWINQSQSSSINFEKILFINSSTGFASGSNGIILKTVNSGSNWVTKPSTLSTNLNCMFYLAPNLWAAGNSGKIIKSIDIGETWFAQNTNNANVTFTGISFSGNDTGYAVSSEGFMYKTFNSGGVVGIVNNNQPQKFELKQNYPNPFNPVTQIEYSLLNSDNVKISVYDISGKFISTLVNEFQNYGTYKIDFDGSSLSSGIYIYKIETKNFIESKKMILLK